MLFFSVDLFLLFFIKWNLATFQKLGIGFLEAKKVEKRKSTRQ